MSGREPRPPAMHALTSSAGGVSSSRGGRGAGNNVGIDSSKRARILPSGSGGAAATCPAPSPSSALALAKRALALRVVFDAAFASALRGYDARLEATRRALAVRGYRRAQRFLPTRKTAGRVLFAAAVATWYYRANRARWARLAAHREKRAALQRELDAATCYEEYKRVAYAMEELQIAFEETEEDGGADRDRDQTPTSADTSDHQSSIDTSSSSSSGLDKKAKGQSKRATSAAAAAAKKKTRADREPEPKPKASSWWIAHHAKPIYDKELIEEQLRLLRAQRACGDVFEMMFNLRADVLRNLGNMSEIGRKLHEPLWGVPKAVREYIDETRAQLRMISNEHDVPTQEKLAFLQETRHCFGRTALLLSGGGTLGTFHVGVARALHARGCLPRVITGSSVGSVVGAIMASRTPDELEEFFSEKHFAHHLPDMTFFSGTDFFSSIQHLMKTGALHDIDFFQRCLRALLGDLTFQEAYDRSGGRILCVCVCATRAGEKPRLLNYLTAPHLVVWSAVAASCAFPSLFPPQPLLAKSRTGSFVPWQPEGKLGARLWRDGSLENDLPMQGLSELFNVNYFIVSQTNPHIVPILRVKRWFASQGPWCAMLASFIESEWRHRCTQVLELVPWIDAFDFAKLFGQQWEGHVTAVMEYSWSQFKKIAANPTREFLFETATMGERSMWPKLATIESNCGIEMQLDECVRGLREKLSARQHGHLFKQRGRVPSWNTINYAGRDSYLRMPRDAHGSAGAVGGTGAGSGGNSAGANSAGREFGGHAQPSAGSAALARDGGGGGGDGGGKSNLLIDAGERESGMSRTSSEGGSLQEFAQLIVDEATSARERERRSHERCGGGGGIDVDDLASTERLVRAIAAMPEGGVKIGAPAMMLPETFGVMSDRGGQHGGVGGRTSGSEREADGGGGGARDRPPGSPNHVHAFSGAKHGSFVRGPGTLK